MTTIQAMHHAEQVAAARAEFCEFWKEEIKRPFLQRICGDARVEHEITAWNAFLKAKGLKK